MSKDAENRGARTDLKMFDELLMKNATDQEIKEAGLVGCLIRYPKYVAAQRLAHPPDWERQRKFILLYGPGGIGKTRYAFDNYPGLYEVPIQTNKDTWFDGYNGQEAVLFDDFAGEMPLTSLLKVADVYLRKVQIKGKKNNL